MTIRQIWNIREVGTPALILAGLFATSLATGLTAAAQSGTFKLTGSLNTARYAHTATLLSNGEVLVAGGENASGTLASAELYNPSRLMDSHGQYEHSAPEPPGGDIAER